MGKLTTAINDAMIESYVEGTCRAENKLVRYHDSGKLQRSTAGVLAVLATFLVPAAAFAARGSGCNTDALKKLVDLIDSAAGFAIAIAAAGSLLVFAIGATLIVFGGDKGPSRGFKWVKGAVIGLIILASAGFIKYVVLNFVAGATQQEGDKACLKKGSGAGANSGSLR